MPARRIVAKPAFVAEPSTFGSIHTNDTYNDMQRLAQLVELCLTGKRRMQMFCSMPGLGKTEEVLIGMKRHGIKPHRSSPANAAALCAHLWRYRNEALFLDDIDTLARSEPCANIIKMSHGSAARLVICPGSKVIEANEDYRTAPHPKYKPDDPATEDFRMLPHPRYDPRIPPPTFTLGPKSCLVWCTNKNFTDPRVVAADMQPDFQAHVSKGLDPLWIRNGPQHVFDYTFHKVVEEGMLKGYPIGASTGCFSAAVVNEVLTFFITNANRLKESTPRAIWKMAQATRDEPSNYHRAWQDMLSPEMTQLITVPAKIPQVGPKPIPLTKWVDLGS
jgi:hypothetical protein